MKVRSKLTILTAAGTVLFAAILFGGNPAAPDLQLIDRLNECVGTRFADPAPLNLGMSRVALPPSFGLHFQPILTSRRDFEPANAAENDALSALETRRIQVGLYVFGAAIANSTEAQLNFRALKGPAAITGGTPRPAWYPPQSVSLAPKAGALPDWAAIYPVAQSALKSFRDGGKGFETRLDTWTIAARPLIASQQRCVSCHNNQAYGRVAPVRLGEAIGGTIYAFRRARLGEGI